MASKNSNLINIAKNLQSSIDKLYKNTYISTNTNSKDLNDIKTNIDISIDKITHRNKENLGHSNISKVYSRMEFKKSIDNKDGDLEEILTDKGLSDNIISAFTENKFIKDYDEDIDIICQYMPKLHTALQAKKDHVLCADSFSKEYLNFSNKSNIREEKMFELRMKELKKLYNLEEFFESCYDNMSYYGEQFVYHAPYTKAFNKLLSVKENAQYDNSEYIIETTFVVKEDVQALNTSIGQESINIMPDYGNINVKLNKSTVLESALNNHSKIIRSINEKTNNISDNKVISDDLQFEDFTSSANDGLIDLDKLSKKSAKIDVPGCVLKRLKRENVIPIYIEDMCLGYYYIECELDELAASRDSMNMIKTNKMQLSNTDTKAKDNILKTVCSKMSKYIDSNFINSNQDLKKELYMILKHNFNMENASYGQMNLNVTFLPPETVTHMYFKKDPNTNRGVSDLHNALVPAKVYISTMMTNTIGLLTRSQDKRVFYVKNHVDTNISKVLLNTMNQLKRSNFGSREIMNIKNFLNVQGQFNDYLVPMGPSGESPLNMEIMQGQDIDMKLEFLTKLEESAVNSTGTPYEYVESSGQVDYAVRITMHNGKFLKDILKRQSIFERPSSNIVSILYNYEYNENDSIELNLPRPGYVDSMNVKQIMDSVNELTESVVEMEMAEIDDEVSKYVFRKHLKRHYINPYIDMNMVRELKDRSIIEAKEYKVDETE